MSSVVEWCMLLCDEFEVMICYVWWLAGSLLWCMCLLVWSCVSSRLSRFDVVLFIVIMFDLLVLSLCSCVS